MAIFLDVFVCLIIIVTIITVVKKGFVRTVLDFSSVIFAVIFAKMFSSPFSEKIYDGLYKGVSEDLKALISKFSEEDLPKLLNSREISDFLGKYNADLSNKISLSNLDEGVEFVAGQLVGLLSYVLAFLIIFFATIVLFKLASLVVGGIFELPILKAVNKTLALFLAIIFSIIYVLIFVAVVQILMPLLTSVSPEIFNDAMIDKTYLFGYLYNFEWIEYFVN